MASLRAASVAKMWRVHPWRAATCAARPFSSAHYGHFGLWMNGEYTEAASGATSSVLNPATLEEVATFASAGPTDTNLNETRKVKIGIILGGILNK